jgi:hypothetical protein
MNSASLCSLVGRYDNPIPTRFLDPIDCLKIPVLAGRDDNPILTRCPAPIDYLKIPFRNIETIDYYEGHDQLSRPSINNKGITDENLARENLAKMDTK